MLVVPGDVSLLFLELVQHSSQVGGLGCFTTSVCAYIHSQLLVFFRFFFYGGAGRGGGGRFENVILSTKTQKLQQDDNF